MSDLTGAMMISGQLASYRLLDDLEEARRIRDERVDSVNYSALLANYNDLIRRFNRLAHEALKVAGRNDLVEAQLRDRDNEIAELKHQLAETCTEEKRLRTRAVELGKEKLYRMWEEEARQKALRSQET